MFSGLSSYLFGGYQQQNNLVGEENIPTIEPTFNVEEIETEEDWMLVSADTKASLQENHTDFSKKKDNQKKLPPKAHRAAVKSTKPRRALKELNPLFMNNTPSEDSKEDKEVTKEKEGIAVQQQQEPPRRSLGFTIVELPPIQPAYNIAAERKKEIMEAKEKKKFLAKIQSDLTAAQKKEQQKVLGVTKKNQLERTNKVQHELTASNKRQRRSDMNKKHSGANNNRKCIFN